MYAKIENNIAVEWPVYDFQIRGAFPNVSFPMRVTAEDFAVYGFEPYAESAKPEFDALVQDVQESAPVKQGSTWVQQWQVVEKYSAEEKAKVLAEAEAQKLEEQKASVRAARNEKLTTSDWTQVADAPVDKTAWATYRQALRDVTVQAGFPWDVEWPEKP